ncbi:MAG TPA: SgcJ/EcaC family oxidoreductase [Methylomirabilota bacterium]|jgi:uncharacterized protein (TIGR02246 family)
MTASNPQDLPALFLRALTASDVDAAASLYEPDGIVAADPDRPVKGRPAIRAMLAGFLDQKPRWSLHDTEVVQAADVALLRSRWTVTMTDAAGVSTRLDVQPTLVARRQAEGHWLVVIDRPA